MTQVQRTALIALIVFLAAVGGVFAGRWLIAYTSPPGRELHTLLHDGLQLTQDQEAKLQILESHFAVRRQALELELRADNAKLAEAIQAEHGNGPRVREAVDRSHAAMGELQKETLAHIFAMRQLLTPDQAAKFDQGVVKALTVERR